MGRAPSVNARREAVVTTGRAFLAALAAYAPDAVYPEDQHRVGRLAALAPHVATDVNGLARAPRRPEAALRIFREDSVTPHGAFPDDATAEAVAAACGVLRVGPRPHRSA